MLVLPGSTEAFARREAGGKGLNLYLMSRDGLPVPAWVVVGARVFAEALEAGGLTTLVADQLASLKAGDAGAKEVSATLMAAVEGLELSPAILSLIEDGVGRLSEGSLLSVRSSAADEDSATHSFAGQLSSYLYVSGLDDVVACVKRCWASGFTERSLAYRMEHGLSLDGIRVAVVLQEMVDPDVSGVLYTCDPIERSIDAYVLSAVFGVGEGLVSGALAADTVWADPLTGAIVKEDIEQKTEAFRASGSGECAAVPVSESEQDKPCLDQAAVTALVELGRTLLKRHGRPQDIEWAIRDGEVFLLQTRPVTAFDRNITGYPNLWDNSNIVESYGGLTQPLSFTFALRNYRSVYVQFCEILHVPAEVVKDMDDYLGHMLGLMHGRVFYNLYNWYKLVGVLPGFSQNREFMETMMGVREALSGEIEARISPHASWNTPLGRFRKMRTGLAFLTYHFTIVGVVERFQREFHEHYDHYRHLDYRSMSSDQIFRTYLEVDRVMISRWKAPIINDFLTMVHFGILKKLTASWLSEVDPNVQNDLIAGDGNLESAEPTKELIRMAGIVAKRPDLRLLIENTPAVDCQEVLSRETAHADFMSRVNLYIDRFGFRCMNEMKLEEIDLYSDSSYLFSCLKNYLRSDTVDLEEYEAREKALREGAEAKVNEHLSGWRKWVYRWSLKNARLAIRNRENTRFARTRIYGVARTMFQAMGEDLAARGVIEHPRDIFFLELGEITSIHSGTLTTTSLPAIIALRKADYARWTDMEPKERFLTRGPVYWQNEILDTPELPDLGDVDYDLIGLPCCPGVVEGIVKIIESAQDDITLNGEILVARRTDPGWVPLYPSASGLLVERGSLLSHSAIVAREMGLPCVVRIPGLTQRLRSGMRVRLDGRAGTVTVLDEGPEAGE